MKPLCKAEIAKRLGISKPSVTLLLQAPDAPAQVGKGRYDLAAVKAFWKSRKALDKAKPTGTYAEPPVKVLTGRPVPRQVRRPSLSLVCEN